MAVTEILKNLNFNPGKKNVDEKFVKDRILSIEEDDVKVVIDNEEAIDKKFSGPTTLRKYMELGRLLIAMLKDTKNGVYSNVPWYTIATIVLVLLYILNPLDIVPDFIPGIGYIDDLAVLSIGMGWIESDLHRYLDWKIQEGERA